MSRFVFYSAPTFEPWDWTNPDTKGIGGSETHHIELARRLADRGHDVYSYAPIPGGPQMNGKAFWEHSDKADFNLSGIWVWARDVAGLDKIEKRYYQQIWFIAQDSFYTDWNEERIAKCDKIFALCNAEKQSMLAKHPTMEGKIEISSNGICSDKMRGLKSLPRNPKRLIYTSSPDRGLKQLLLIFRRAKEYVSDLELHAYYGFNNIEKIIEKMPYSGFINNKNEIESLLHQPSVFWHGRTPQPKLWEEWLQSGIWCYPANFTETSCISCMEAQALGAIPICNPIWAVGENVKHGIFIDGDVNDPLVLARYTAEVVRMASQSIIQEQIRAQMMPCAMEKFDWEHIADQFEEMA